MKKKDLRSYSYTELIEIVEKLNEKPFRAKQIYQWLWKHGVFSFDEMKNIPKALLNALKEKYNLTICDISDTIESEDETIKVAFKLFDDLIIEGVIIPAPSRLTACLSTQVGCPANCGFCATGKMGFNRNLSTAEIFIQFFLLNNMALKKFGKAITNIVIMGMGEPLLNYENVLSFTNIINSEEGLNFSSRRITLSTVGIPQAIKRLADDNVKFKLALSLHATTDEKRDQIIPFNVHNNIDAVMEALQYFYKKNKNIITFEYLLLKGFNDSRTDALQLAALCHKIPSKVNIIEFNSFENAEFEKSDDVMAGNFCRILEEQEVTCTLRKSKGNLINAACGQLSNKLANNRTNI